MRGGNGIGAGAGRAVRRRCVACDAAARFRLLRHTAAAGLPGLGLVAMAGLLPAAGAIGAADPAEVRASSASAPAESVVLTDYALGLAVVNKPSFSGSDEQKWRLRPLWAIRHGRYRLGGGGLSGLLARPGESGSSGASADLVESSRWKIGVSLSMDGGRKPDDDPGLAGTAVIRRTLRGKVYASTPLARQWTLSGAYSHDLLGRGGGGDLSVDLGWGRMLWPGWHLGLGWGATWADDTTMRAQFGLPAETALAAGRQPFAARAGWRDLHAGAGLRVGLSSRWFVFGGLGATRLLGDAAASPLSTRRVDASVSLGLAWRNRD